MQRSRSNTKNNHNLRLRLGPASLPKERMFARNCGRVFPNVITIDDDDDDDDVQVNPRNQRARTPTMGLFPLASSRTTVTDEDLELRLGRKEYLPAMNQGRTINGLAEPLQAWNSFKAKYEAASSSRRCPELQEIRLRCSICMDTMKEETSTVCGHVFCRICISNAIIAQKRCPTCRKELSLNGIHRIYLPGALS